MRSEFSIIVADGILELAGASIDGGADTDTLILADEASSTTVDEIGLFDVLIDMEVIDFTGTNINASLSISSTDINDSLTLNFDGGDSVSLTDPIANYTSNTVGSTTTYTIYDDASQTTQIAELIVNT